MNESLHPLEILVSQSNWRLFITRKADPAFLTFQKRVFSRDAHRCGYCGFQAKQHMEVVNLDGNYLNNKMSNLVTACPLCAQCLFMEGVGKGDFGGGVLIYLPEFSQNELNSLCHHLFNSIVCGNSLSASAKNIYRDLKLRAHLVEKHMGVGFSNPALYGQIMIDATAKNKEDMHKELSKKLRLLPAIKKFSTCIQDWSRDAVEEMIL